MLETIILRRIIKFSKGNKNNGFPPTFLSTHPIGRYLPIWIFCSKDHAWPAMLLVLLSVKEDWFWVFLVFKALQIFCYCYFAFIYIALTFWEWTVFTCPGAQATNGVSFHTLTWLSDLNFFGSLTPLPGYTNIKATVFQTTPGPEAFI